MTKKDNIILNLIRDYEDYLGDLSLKELKKISIGGVFTLFELEAEKYLKRRNNVGL